MIQNQPNTDPLLAPLTPLRDDLKLLPGPHLEGGSPTWTLHDPPTNNFYRIGRHEFEILARWPQYNQLRNAATIAEEVNQKTTLKINGDDVLEIQQFFAVNCLLRAGTPASNHMIKTRAARKTSIFTWLIHNYLSLRIPIFKPQKFLNSTLPLVKILTGKTSRLLFILLTIMGLFMISRQWQSFQHTFKYFFSMQGFIYYATALFMVKLFHELGHAYTAAHYKVKVPSIGVAFIVLWPMLYSDTTESWKLTDRMARMRIVAAGIITELVLAVIATLLWSFAPPGPLKSACFIVATATWLSSLFMNLSPFMRFDGYYMLSDYLDIPNLQQRAFNLGKWLLRRTVIGLYNPCPEQFSPGRTRLLIFYAYATWLYRLVLFTTIALVVYHKFFKILGLILFSVEISCFVILPILKELDIWWQCRSETGYCNRNILASLCLIALTVALIMLPWNSRLKTSAVLISPQRQKIFAPLAAKIVKIHIKNGQKVSKGQILFTLTEPHLDLKENSAQKRIESMELLILRQIANSSLLAPRQIIQSQITTAMTELNGYKKQKRRLLVRAPTDGTIVDLDENLRKGQWINEKTQLALVIDGQQSRIEGYLEEEMLAVIKAGNNALFYPDNRNQRISCTMESIEPVNQLVLNEPYLASVYGGELPVSIVNRQLVSQKGLYRILLSISNKIPVPQQVVRGHLILMGRPESIFTRAKRRLMAVLIRESGF